MPTSRRQKCSAFPPFGKWVHRYWKLFHWLIRGIATGKVARPRDVRSFRPPLTFFLSFRPLSSSMVTSSCFSNNITHSSIFPSSILPSFPRFKAPHIIVRVARIDRLRSIRAVATRIARRSYSRLAQTSAALSALTLGTSVRAMATSGNNRNVPGNVPNSRCWRMECSSILFARALRNSKRKDSKWSPTRDSIHAGQSKPVPIVTLQLVKFWVVQVLDGVPTTSKQIQTYHVQLCLFEMRSTATFAPKRFPQCRPTTLIHTHPGEAEMGTHRDPTYPLEKLCIGNR